MNNAKLIDFFSKKDVLKLTNISLGKLNYLMTIGLIKPLKVGKSCYFSWHDIIEVKTIFELRKNTKLVTIRNAKEYFEEIGKQPTFRDKKIVACDNEIYFYSNNDNLEEIITQITGKHKRQIIMFLDTNKLLNEIESNGKKNNVINFEKKWLQVA